MPKLNKYDMGHNFTTGFRVGQLYVSMIQDITPGEVWYGRSTSVARIDPLNKPTFMGLKIFRRKFFVPYRIIDDSFADWYTGQAAHTFPTHNIGTGGAANIEFFKIFGLNITVARATHLVCAWPMYAYNLIWNKHFRGQDVAEVALSSVIPHRVSHPTNSYHGNIRSNMQLGTAVSTVGFTTVPEYRDAWAEQRLQEHRELYGDKYIDQLRRFGVKVPYGLVDEPVPVDSARGVAGISEVVETAETGASGGSPGQLAGHGITMFGSRFKPRKFVEPGILMEVCYARPRLHLTDNTSRIWIKGGTEDHSFYQPELAVKSDATVLSDEIHSVNSATNSNYGYVDNYDWLRSAQDTLAGQVNTTDYKAYSAHKRLSAVPTVAALQYVDDYDDLFQNGTSTYRSDVLLYTAHRYQKLSPVRKRGRS